MILGTTMYILCALFLSITTLIAQTQHDRSAEYWDWNSISTECNFPENFAFGSAVAEYQVSGAVHCKDSNWAHWEKAAKLEPSHNACDFWNTCFDDIQLIKDLGLNSFRFSVDWSMIEPKQGEFNQDALDHYELYCKKLLENGIQPVATLHHFVHPQWFEELGGFEKEENIAHFVKFSEVVFARLHPHVSLWCTINEPSIYIFGGYLRAGFPPGRIYPQKAAVVLGNLLKSHVAIYHALKRLPGGAEAKVGIVHQMMPFKTLHTGGVRGAIERYLAGLCNHMLNDSVLNFFLTGDYRFSVGCGLVANVEFSQPEAVGSLDFFGINYYSHILISLSLKRGISEGYREDDIRTDMPYALYPEGLYHEIVKASKLNVPIYITENGIADVQDDKRALWIERHLYAVNKAIEDGYDVRGYFYWSLLDNYEWDLGYPPKFGLYHVDKETQKRTLRDGARTFQNIVKR